MGDLLGLTVACRIQTTRNPNRSGTAWNPSVPNDIGTHDIGFHNRSLRFCAESKLSPSNSLADHRTSWSIHWIPNGSPASDGHASSPRAPQESELECGGSVVCATSTDHLSKLRSTVGDWGPENHQNLTNRMKMKLIGFLHSRCISVVWRSAGSAGPMGYASFCCAGRPQQFEDLGVSGPLCWASSWRCGVIFSSLVR